MHDNKTIISQLESDRTALVEHIGKSQRSLRAIEAALAFYHSGGMEGIKGVSSVPVEESAPPPPPPPPQNGSTQTEEGQRPGPGWQIVEKQSEIDGAQAKLLIMRYIHGVSRFVGKADVQNFLRSAEYEGHTSTITHHLKQLCDAGKLYRIQYGSGFQYVFYGLPQWVTEGPQGPTFTSERYAPEADRRGTVSRAAMIWGKEEERRSVKLF